MKNDREEKPPQPAATNPGAQSLAQNPNPRANQNIPPGKEETDRENREIENAVGSQITDGEDA